MSLFPLSDILSGGTKQLRTELVKTTVATEILQNAVSTSGNGVSFSVDGFGVATLQITGTFVATVTFYGSVDGTNFVNISAYDRNSKTEVLSTTNTGIFEINCRGLKKIRAVVTWTSGTSVTIVGVAEPFVGQNHAMQLTGSNGGQVTVTNGKLDVNAQVVATGETIVTAPLTRVVTLTDTPVSLTSKSNLRQITVRNIDPVLRSRIGETGMTAANGKGIALEPQAVYQESFDPTIPVTIYGRSEGASMQVEVYEA